jgi:hypothetical protein
MAKLELKCEECGNDGTRSSLFLTIDAKYRDGEWELEEREDDGGMELDCLECDHRTNFSTGDGEVPFPYGMTFKISNMAAIITRDPRAQTAVDKIEEQIKSWSQWATPTLDDPEAQATPESENADAIIDVLNDIRRAVLSTEVNLYFDKDGNRREVTP